MATKFRAKLAITLRLCKRYLRDFCIYRGVFGDEPANATNRLTDPRCNWNKIWNKMGYNSTYIRQLNTYKWPSYFIL